MCHLHRSRVPYHFDTSAPLKSMAQAIEIRFKVAIVALMERMPYNAIAMAKCDVGA